MIEIYFLIFLEAGSSRSRSQQIGLLSSLFWASRWLSSHRVLKVAFPLGMYREYLVSLLLIVHQYYWIETPSLCSYLTLITSLKFLSPNTVTLGGLRHMNFSGGIQFSPQHQLTTGPNCVK